MKPLRRYQPNRKVNLTSEELYKLYWNDHLSTEEIAEMFYVTSPTVWQLMKRAEIPCRTMGESIRLAQSKGRRCQDYPKGDKHPNWKGGRWVNSSGYVLVYMFNHRRAYKFGNSCSYVLEHILIWEQYHNQQLPEGWHIHHLNGIKTDNRPENLQALPKKSHYNLIPALKARIKELEAKIDGIGKKRAELCYNHFNRRNKNE